MRVVVVAITFVDTPIPVDSTALLVIVTHLYALLIAARVTEHLVGTINVTVTKDCKETQKDSPNACPKRKRTISFSRKSLKSKYPNA